MFLDKMVHFLATPLFFLLSLNSCNTVPRPMTKKNTFSLPNVDCLTSNCEPELRKWKTREKSLPSNITLKNLPEKPSGKLLCIENDVTQKSYEVLRYFNAKQFQGRRVVIEATVFLASENTNSSVKMAIIESGPSPKDYIHYLIGSKNKTNRWLKLGASIDVGSKIDHLVLSTKISGKSILYIESIRFKIDENAIFASEPPRELSDLEVSNIVTFAKLYGYIRYFYPGIATTQLDWDRFAADGIEKVESSATDGELMGTLQQIFQPIVPSLVVRKNPIPQADTETCDSDRQQDFVSWRHIGYNPVPGGKFFNSQLIITNKIPKTNIAIISQYLSPVTIRKKLLTVSVISTSKSPSVVSPYISERSTKLYAGSKKNTKIETIQINKKWYKHSVSFRVPNNASYLSVGMRYNGSIGEYVLVDYLEIKVDREKSDIVRNQSFGQGTLGKLDFSWHYSLTNPNVSIRLSRKESLTGNRTVVFSTSPVKKSDNLCKTYTSSIGHHLYASFPLSLPLSSKVAKVSTLNLKSNVSPILNANDRYTRLAGVIVTWNVVRYFHPFINRFLKRWQRSLPKSLREASNGKNEIEYLNVLKEMLSILGDAHANVFRTKKTYTGYLPVYWSWVENKLVITAVDKDKVKNLSVGNIVTAINGVDTDELLNKELKYISFPTRNFAKYYSTFFLREGKYNSPAYLKIIDNSNKKNKRIELSYSDEFAYGRRSDNRESLFEISPGIVYVDITRVSDEKMYNFLDLLCSAKGLIVDVRGYPMQSLTLLQHLTEKPLRSPYFDVPIMISPDRSKKTVFRSSWNILPMKPHIGAQCVFLTNEAALSYSETYLSFVENYNLGTIVGGQTAGTNGSPIRFSLPDNYTVMFTGEKVVNQNGKINFGEGINPSVFLEPTIDSIRVQRDLLIDMALDILKQK